MNELVNAWLKVGAGSFFLLLFAYAILWHAIPHWKARDLKKLEFQQKLALSAEERESKRDDRTESILKEISGLIQQNVTQGSKITDGIAAVAELTREEARLTREEVRARRRG